MKRFLTPILTSCLLVALVFPVVGEAATAKTKEKPFNYIRIFYYREGKFARESLFKYSSYIDVFAPQSYAFNSGGELVGGLEDDVLAFVQKKKIKIMPLVTNSGFKESVLKTILEDSSKQDLAIKQLIEEAEKHGYWGWQIDFEQMNLSYRDEFTSFIKKYSEELRKKNLVPSVAVMAQVSGNSVDYSKDLWQRILGAYDYKELGSVVDFVSLMSYDDPTSKGPVAPLPWMKDVLEHALELIPAEKISLGIPLYFLLRDDATGKIVQMGGREGVQNVLNNRKVSYGYSTTNAATILRYSKGKKKYTLWYEDSQSMKPKVDLIKKYKLHGFSAWALGLEMSSVYSVFKK